MIINIEHIAIKVADIPAMAEAFAALQFDCGKVRQYPEVGIDIAFLGYGETKIELLQMTDSASPISHDPYGLHHVALKTKDIEAIFDIVSKNDLFIVDSEIMQGSCSRIFFFRIRTQKEILFECSE